jgi:hypothetical protein
MTEQMAEQGWMLRVETTEAASEPAVIYFAVGKNSSQEALAAVLEYSGIDTGDEVTWADRLTRTEIRSFRLRPDEVRTYGKRLLSRNPAQTVTAPPKVIGPAPFQPAPTIEHQRAE